MKEKELNELLDKAIGTKGNLRIPSYWMRKVFSGLMEWCKTLTPKLDISKSDIPTKISQLENDVELATQSYVNAEINYVANQKQDKITDLSTIRSNAAKGATAIQSVKTINGKSVVGSGDILLVTEDEFNQLKDEIIANELVVAEALNDINERIKNFANEDYVAIAVSKVITTALNEEV